MTRALEYRRVPNDEYPDQVTLTRYPGWFLRLLGFGPTVTVYVSRDWEFHSGWYEIPSMKEVGWGWFDLGITDEFHRLIRQIKYTERVPA